MEPLLESGATLWPFPFTEQNWEQTPPAVQAYLHTLRHEVGQLQERVESLEARLTQDSTTSSRGKCGIRVKNFTGVVFLENLAFSDCTSVV